MNITVIGSSGFIGKEFCKQAVELGYNVYAPVRGDERLFERDLGNVIYAAGYGNCGENYLNVLDANCTFLSRLLAEASFESITYLSSTRVFLDGSTTHEAASLVSSFHDKRRLFNLTKLVAEELLLLNSKRSLIIRPSNVYGLALESELFLPSIIRDALNKQVVDMYVTPNYSKDYIFVGDLVQTTLQLMKIEESGIYNIASGENTSALEIADVLKSTTNSSINWHVKEDIDFFEAIDVSKISEVIDFKPRNVLNDLKSMVHEYSQVINN